MSDIRPSSNPQEDPLEPPPTAPRLSSLALPSNEAATMEQSGASSLQDITPETELSTLTTQQLQELTQKFFDDTLSSRPLISALGSIGSLRTEYTSPSFISQLQYLESNGYVGIRRTRGDGDCFYRSLAFAYIERIMQAPDKELAVAKATSQLYETQKLLDAAGFQKMAYEDFYDVIVSLLETVVNGSNGSQPLTPALLLQAFQDPEVSNSVVVYLRLLTSAQIRADPDSYAPFLVHPEADIPLEVREFCEGFVEAIGREADHVQVTALSRALHVNVEVAYLDGRNPDHVDFVKFDNETEHDTKPILLLYRPGHYDILEREKSGASA
ncbi:cysteine proteinase [Sistotremastrum niveocremeum HHB9708]|uniref:ubiquitinyl hydrolase 1 n=2 Tax=Sistotremastraceae TaxID=3402574 RepID=A0A164WTS9_9AGAM|nr:cysteine proteinase [Sistotremastrum niveocremeum HHB9708]KZT37163.1 cysteine proteinase [Sistotremastrum suecicum HHB10207 ss-3]